MLLGYQLSVKKVTDQQVTFQLVGTFIVSEALLSPRKGSVDYNSNIHREYMMFRAADTFNGN